MVSVLRPDVDLHPVHGSREPTGCFVVLTVDPLSLPTSVVSSYE